MIEAASAVLPDAVEEAALTELGDAVERRDLVGDEGPPERARVLLRLGRVLRPRDRDGALAHHPVEGDLRRRLADDLQNVAQRSSRVRFLNAPYGDNFTIVQLLTGELKPT